MSTQISRLSREEFTAAFKAARRVRFKGGQLLRAPLPPSGSYKVAVVVSKKISKKAVVRNRLRRQMYAFFRTYTVPPGTYIVILSPEVHTHSLVELYEDLANVLNASLRIPRKTVE